MFARFTLEIIRSIVNTMASSVQSGSTPLNWKDGTLPAGLEDVRMPMPEDEGPKRALVVSAHPDDSEFGAAGTVYQWTKEGWEFYYLICTDGSKGSEDPAWTPDRLVPTRKDEQRAAAAVLGVKEVFFLDNVDGELTYNKDFMREVVRKIRQLKPHACFGHDPGQIVRNMFINHPDHRAAGETLLDAVYPLARNRPSFPELLEEGLEPFSVKEVYLWTKHYNPDWCSIEKK